MDTVNIVTATFAVVAGLWVRVSANVPSGLPLTIPQATALASLLVAEGEIVEIRHTGNTVNDRFGARFIFGVKDGFWRRLPISVTAWTGLRVARA